MQSNIFREYDIRGIVDQDFDDKDINILGKAIGTYLDNHGVKKITLGRDCRTHGPRVRDALVDGLLSTGLELLDIGICTSPLLYYSVYQFEVEGGVMITASHNPPEYNGFKVVLGKTTIYGQEIRKLYDLAEAGSFAGGQGGSVTEVDAISPYLDYVADNISLAGPISLAVDGGNGTAGPIAIPLMERLGLKPVPLYCDMDGNFPNHEPDPTVMENLTDLIKVVQDKDLQCGVAYDGDGDRVGVVDEKGQPIYGDMLLAIYARSIAKEHPGATFIGEVKCSKNLYDDIKNHGGNPIMWRTGHSLIKQKMLETGALLAGEMSGHMFFKHRWFGFDDGIYASLRLIELMSRSDAPLSTWLADLPAMVSTPEIRVECADEIKFKVVDKVVADLKSKYDVVDVDGARVTFPDGWGLARASNTQPALVLRFEAESQGRLDEIRDIVESTIEAAKKAL
jgi:phosphomannomutase/phosphoglucomutase